MGDVTQKKRIQIPVDDANHPVPLTPSGTALARTVSGTISSAQIITLNAATTFIRCYATTQDVYLRWGTALVSSTTFDEVIPANQIVDLYVPTGTIGTALTLIERGTTASVVLIEK